MQKSRLQELMNILHALSDEAVVELGAILSGWEQESPAMDREEALVRLLWEISKEPGSRD